jgi:hypothetical protein
MPFLPIGARLLPGRAAAGAPAIIHRKPPPATGKALFRRGDEDAVPVAPGFVYSGQRWEAGVEALIPATRAAGGGAGVIAQVHASPGFLFPETLGRPLFRR